MLRPYKDSETDNVTMFVGIEQENTEHKGKKTLFVVGYLPSEFILFTALEHFVDHIYLGANRSYSSSDKFLDLVNEVKKTFDVTLDVPMHQYSNLVCKRPDVLENICILLSSPPIPHASKYNLYVKIDDIGLCDTNGCVWVHKLSDLMFNGTTKDKYLQDEIIC